MALISLSGMEFFAYHGCFTEEQIIGNKFLVDLEFVADTGDAELTDDLTKTINYQKVYETIKIEMAVKSKLLEHVARRILDSVHTKFPEVTKLKVTVTKLNPAVGGTVDRVSVTIDR
jgi:dihydroneopterin aldolase